MSDQASDDRLSPFRDPKASEALRIIGALVDAGFVAYLAGGCVRDALLGRAPKDFDVATNATPESVREVFGRRKTLSFGASFGVIGVLPEKRGHSNSGTVEPTEVATFRSDGKYSDGRHPDSVQFGDPKEDALRRDFTINGLFYDPASESVIDYVGGQADLNAQILRTIGDSSLRFDEDKLRMLRAIRFATTLDFAIDPDTFAAIQQYADDIDVVSGERIGAEMRRILISPRAATGLKRIEDSGLGRIVLPEFSGADEVTVDSHLENLAARDFASAMACALVAAEQQESLPAITDRWKLSNEEQRMIRAAMNHWETFVNADSLRWSQLQPRLIDRDAAVVLNVAESIAKARGLSRSGIAVVQDALGWPPERLNPPPLVTGNDLQSAGVPTGPHYKTLLQTIRDQQLDGKISTAAEALQLAMQL